MSRGIDGFNEGYIPTTWTTGDVITAEKLNNMEDGISSNEQLLVKIPFTWDEEDNPVVDKTFDEILEILDSSKIPFLLGILEDDGAKYYNLYNFCFADNENKIMFVQNSGGSQPTVVTITINADDTVELNTVYLPPEIDDGDVGKVLSVNPNYSTSWLSLT